MTGTVGRVTAVCVVHTLVPLGRAAVVDSAIDKRPVDGPVGSGACGTTPVKVDVHELGIAGDHSSDTTFHGGLDQAIYAYDDAEALRWADELGVDVPPGRFGENLRTSGVPVTDAVIGSRWRIGSVLLEATIARRPCRTFALWVEEDRWIRRFTVRGDVGAYFRVLEPGIFGRGDAVTVTSVPEHGVTVRMLFEGRDSAAMQTLLDTPGLAPKVYRDAAAALKSIRN